MFKRIFLTVYTIMVVTKVMCQSDNIPLNDKFYHLLDRLDVKLQNDTSLGFTTVKPYNRKTITERIQYLASLNDSTGYTSLFSPVDRYNMSRLMADNTEWLSNYNDSARTEHTFFKKIYQSPDHFFSVNSKELTLRVEPLLNLQYGHSNDGTGNIYQNTRGILLRGNINRTIGFYSVLTDNQERDPLFVQQWVNAHQAVPGVGFYKPYGKEGYDYFDVKGGISFNAARYIHFQFCYDKLFIGNGYRSLFLSDFSNSYLFMRLTTRLWKINYEMILAQTIQSVPQIGREMKPQNYMAIHHLSAQLAKWLNVGFYENIMEDGKYGLQFSYLNPVIFYRAAESNIGAAGKCNLGFDVKANVTRQLQLYAQLLINEFQVKEVLHYKRGSWVNKQALQGGIKYMDAFGIANMDLQAEVNWIRPFTYTNFDSVTNFTHYNQPLAHPSGANLRELIALIHYQPSPRLYISGKASYLMQGADSAGYNMGANIFKSYNSRPRDYGFFIGTGIPVKIVTFNVNASWEIFRNLFLDLSATYRRCKMDAQPQSNVFFYSSGLRLNLPARSFNF